MNLYDEGNPLLRPRSFWEEEEELEPIVPPVEPVAPPAAPELPEVEGEGYASPEEAAAGVPLVKPPALPEVEGPGFASPEEAAAGKLPEVEGEGYASPEEAAGAVKPSLGDLARLGYRTLVAPLTEPVEAGREMVEAARLGVEAVKEGIRPEGTRRAEFVERIKRGAATGTEELKAGWRQMSSEALRLQQNPYIEKSTEEAKADIPKLEQQIAETEKSMIASGADPKLAGMEWRYGVELTPEQKQQTASLGDFHRQLMQAKQAATGAPSELFLGTLSRSFADVAEANRDRKAEIIKEYGDRIDESRNKELFMQVADSLGASAPSMGASMLNPLFGLSLMYSQTYETTRSEFLKKGGDPARADEYAHKQAALQTPLELVGDLAFVNLAKATLKRLVTKEANPEAWATWIKQRAVDIGKATAGEVGITTPGQTIIEQELGEEYGVKPKKTAAEKAAAVGEAMKVAGLQSAFLAGGPTVVEAGVRSAGDIAAAIQPPAAVPPVTVPPVEPPAFPPTPPEEFAPPGAMAPGVTITPAPGEVPLPPDLAAPPAAVPPVVPPPAAAPPPTIEAGPPTPAGAAVTGFVGAQNIAVKKVADTQAQNLQAAGAPETAKAIQQVAARSNTEASVTAAEYLEQAKVQAAEAAAEAAAAPPAEGVAAAPPRAFGVPPPIPEAPVSPYAPPAAVQPAPAAPPAPAVVPPAAPRAEPQSAVVVGGQVFTGATHEEAMRVAHTAVGTDAMGSAEGGWVDPESGRFVSHEIYDAHQAFNAAVEAAGGDTAHPSVATALAQLAEAQERDAEVNNQIVQPGGEQVVQPGIKGQEALVATRPSQELAVPLAGVNVAVEGVTPEGQVTTAQRPAAQALNDARNDRTALTLLIDCLR